MNEHEAERIACAMHVARPDWPVRQLRTLIREKLNDRPRRDVFVALAWIASESGSHTPYRVLESGPWWIATAVDGQTTGRREPYDPTRFCGVCNRPNDQRHPQDHGFISAIDDRRQQPDPAHVAAMVEYAKSGIGDAKAAREPVVVEPLPELPQVARLRAEVQATAAPDDEPEPTREPARMTEPPTPTRMEDQR